MLLNHETGNEQSGTVTAVRIGRYLGHCLHLQQGADGVTSLKCKVTSCSGVEHAISRAADIKVIVDLLAVLALPVDILQSQSMSSHHRAVIYLLNVNKDRPQSSKTQAPLFTAWAFHLTTR